MEPAGRLLFRPPRMENVTDLTKGIYRRMYSGFIKGHRINKLSLEAEAWFWRVLASADDFGNADADPGLCYAATVGRRAGITIRQVEKWLGELGESGLIQIYPDGNGDKYLHIVGFEDLQPAGKNGKRVRKFPPPSDPELFQINPDFFDSSLASHSHSDPHSHSGKRLETKKGNRLPESFTVDESMKAWASRECPGLDVNRITEGFRDYWKGVPGAKGRKLDWQATWRNWLRTDFTKRNNGNGQSHPNAYVKGKMVV